MKKIRIALAHRSKLFISTMQQLIERTEHIETVATAFDDETLNMLLHRTAFDLLLLDEDFKNNETSQLITQIAEERIHIKIIIMGNEYNKFSNKNICGFIAKNSPTEEWEKTIVETAGIIL